MRKLVASTALATATLWAVQAHAQEAGATASTAIEDQAAADANVIVVTAQRRAESAQEVPISLTALDSTELEQTGVRSVTDLPRIVPSFSLQKAQQVSNTRLAIRGIGSSGNTAIEPSVGAFVDGVYIARPGSLLAGLNDIASVEVLRGPQGTLFGRNASMGAISFSTAVPASSFEASAGAEYGSFDRVRLTGMVNAPITQDVAIRIAGLYDDSDGYGRNLFIPGRFGGNTLKSLRGTLRADLGANLTWTVRGDYQKSDGDGQAVNTVLEDTVTPQIRANYIARANGLVPFLDRSYSRDVFQYTEGSLRDEQWGVSSKFELFLGDYTLSLLSAYRDWDNNQIERDATSTPIDIFGRDASFSSTTHSQELQLSSPDDLLDGRLSFVAGLYYFHEDYSIGEQLRLGDGYCDVILARVAPALLPSCYAGPSFPASTLDFDQTTESLAAYGQATINLTDTLRLTGGIRYSHDSKDADLASVILNPANIIRRPDVVEGLRFSGGKVTYRGNLSYDVTPDIMVFATYATGYKSGGFDAGNGAVLGQNRVFDPELTTNYEIGIKSQFLDRRLTANATLFRTDIDDFQLRSYNGLAFSVRNAGSIRQQGVEFELRARPVGGLSLGVAGTYLDSEYTDFQNAPGLPGFGGVQDLTGQRAPTSPEWQGNVNASYTGTLSDNAGMDWSLSSNLAFQSDSDVGTNGDNNPQGIQSGYALLGARFAILDANERWELYLAGDNLTDKRYCNLIFPHPFNGPLGLTDPDTGGAVQRCTLAEPRTIRIGVKVKVG